MKPRDRRGEDLSYYWDRGTKNVMVEVEEGDVIHVRRCQGLEELRCSRQGGKGASLLHSQESTHNPTYSRGISEPWQTSPDLHNITHPTYSIHLI